MFLFESGKVGQFVCMLVLLAVALYWLYASRKNPPTIRRLAALDALEEMAGRAVELNKPIIFNSGAYKTATNFISSGAAAQVASVSIMGYVAQLAAKYSAPLMNLINSPEQHALAEQVVKEAYTLEGKEEDYAPGKQCLIMGASDFSFRAAVLGALAYEQPAGHIMIGIFGAGAVMFAEAGARTGAIQIGGTAGERTANIAMFAVLCDYFLIHEEVLAAGAYLSNDPTQAGSIRAQDWGRLFAVGITIVGIILINLGSSLIIDLLKM